MNRDKIIYSILKELENGNEPTANDYEITLEQFGDIVEQIVDSNLIKNAQVIRAGIGNKVKMVFLKHAKITDEGYRYLRENSVWAKTYKGLKEFREWIKL